MSKIIKPVANDSSISWGDIRHFASIGICEWLARNELNLSVYLKLFKLLKGNHIFWYPLLPDYDSNQSIALVIDDSYGNISYQLSLRFKKVITVHQDDRALETISQYLESKNINNVQLVKMAIGSVFPVPSSSVSLVVVMRLSNYIDQYADKNRAEYYKQFLEESCRILTSDGTVMILDNNKNSYQAIAGRVRGRNRFDRVVGVSPKYTKKSLIKKGFSVDEYIGKQIYTQTLDGAPSYLNFNTPATGDPLKYGLLNKLKLKLQNSAILKQRWSSFIIVATRSSTDNLVRKILIDSKCVDDQVVDKYFVKRIISGNAGVVVIIVGKMDCAEEEDFVLRLPGSKEAIEKVECNWAALKSLSASSCSKVIPKNVAKGCFKEQFYYIEERKKGKDLESGDIGLEVSKALYDSFLLLINIQTESKSKAHKQRQFVDHYLNNLSSRLASFCNKSEIDVLNKILACLRNVLNSCEIPLVRVHGDFKPGNILYNRDGTTSAIIDWDMSQPAGLPLIDFYTYFIYQIAKEKNTSISNAFNDYILYWDVRDEYKNIVNIAREKFHISERSLLSLRCMSWLIIIELQISDVYLTHPQTARMMLGGTFNKMIAVLEAQNI